MEWYRSHLKPIGKAGLQLFNGVFLITKNLLTEARVRNFTSWCKSWAISSADEDLLDGELVKAMAALRSRRTFSPLGILLEQLYPTMRHMGLDETRMDFHYRWLTAFCYAPLLSTFLELNGTVLKMTDMKGVNTVPGNPYRHDGCFTSKDVN
ncbi:hypothetical protein BGZ65_009450 [Modicella reniformis]|uniref:Uncharacterized protein n=1 Tax=Modicella reniformis TaxID=1440133 RepID=A0A9P6MKL2_9FUNG|nr:hypothetical protein BGZ65_009450 [Modicella reniformis]